MASTEPPLPSDVIAIVLGHLRTPIRSDDEGAERAERAILCSAALVHRSYTLAAQSQLNESISIRTAEQVAAIEAAIEAGRLSLALIRVISLEPQLSDIDSLTLHQMATGEAASARSELIWRALEATNALARRCPNLAAIRLANQEVLEDWRGLASWPPVELIVGARVGRGSAAALACEALNRPAAAFRSLTLLSVGYTKPSIFYDLTASALGRLVRLQLGSRQQPLDLTATIVNPTAPSLRTLELYLRTWDDGNAPRCLLALPAPVGTTYSPSDTAFPALHSLIMAGAQIPPQGCRDVLERLPPSLQHLTVEAIEPTSTYQSQKERLSELADRATAHRYMAWTLIHHIKGASVAARASADVVRGRWSAQTDRPRCDVG